MPDSPKKQPPSTKDLGSNPDLYDRSVADDSASSPTEDEPGVVESNSSNYGASSVVGEQGE